MSILSGVYAVEGRSWKRSHLRGEASPSRSFSLDPSDIKSIREGFGLTQAQFAAMMGISVSTLRNWEQGRRLPEGPARILLQVAARYPEAVLDVVHNTTP